MIKNISPFAQCKGTFNVLLYRVKATMSLLSECVLREFYVLFIFEWRQWSEKMFVFASVQCKCTVKVQLYWSESKSFLWSLSLLIKLDYLWTICNRRHFRSKWTLTVRWIERNSTDVLLTVQVLQQNLVLQPTLLQPFAVVAKGPSMMLSQ